VAGRGPPLRCRRLPRGDPAHVPAARRVLGATSRPACTERRACSRAVPARLGSRRRCSLQAKPLVQPQGWPGRHESLVPMRSPGGGISVEVLRLSRGQILINLAARADF
jgi:hypothetical protein